MTGVQMIQAGWVPDKVLRMQWECDGRPIELISPFGFLSRIVPSRQFLAVIEDTDPTGQHAALSLYLPNGAVARTFPNVLDLFPTELFPARREAGEYSWFRTPVSPLPTAFAAVFQLYRNGATYRVEIDAATGTVLSTQEFR